MYEFTRKLYRKLFNQEYSICYCHSCIMRRMAAASKFSILLKSGNKQSQPEEPAIINNPLFSKDEGFSHISTHNLLTTTSRAELWKRKNLLQLQCWKKIATTPITIIIIILRCLLWHLVLQ